MRVFIVSTFAVLLLSGLALGSSTKHRKNQQSSSSSSSSSEEDRYQTRSNQIKRNGGGGDRVIGKCYPYNHFIKMLQYLATDLHYTDEKIEGLARGMCDQLLKPGHGAKCNRFIDENKGTFFGMYRTHSADEVAEALGLCKGGETYTRVSGEVKQIYCKPCKWIVEQLKDMFGGSMTFEEFKDMLKKLCAKIPLPGIFTCKQLIDKYAEPIYNALKEGSAGTICSQIGLCPFP